MACLSYKVALPCMNCNVLLLVVVAAFTLQVGVLALLEMTLSILVGVDVCASLIRALKLKDFEDLGSIPVNVFKFSILAS